MATLGRSVPTYDLYGDADAPPREEFFHCETIKVRSQRYDWDIAPHVHPALHQVLFLAKGQVDLRLAERTRPLVGPLLVRVPRGTVHGFHFSPDVVGLVVSVSQDFIDSLSRQDALHRQMQLQAVDHPAPAVTRRLLQVGREFLAAEHDRFDPDAHRLHRALGEAWLRMAVQTTPKRNATSSSLAERFQALVETNYRAHRPLSFYAAQLNCTERTLSRQVSAAFGLTPLQLINRRLLFEARRLLRFTNASVSDVAAELGFEDPSYFSRVYQRLAGRRPSADKGQVPVRSLSPMAER